MFIRKSIFVLLWFIIFILMSVGVLLIARWNDMLATLVGILVGSLFGQLVCESWLQKFSKW